MKAKSSRFKLFLFLTAIAMFALVTTQPTRTARAAGKTVVVTMTDKPPAYVPEKLTVKAGATVVWKNTAQSLHDVPTDPSMAQSQSDVALPQGVKPFDSG
ncbi:MAG TPA: hypothetical protein VNF99_14150, partial [Stellaceae bacterium]|nr:hypothetical protein [Stellaceae bacterium]